MSSLTFPPAPDWNRFMRRCHPELRSKLRTSGARLREVHAHGWTVAVAPDALPTLSRRRDDLERALTSIHGNSPKAVHLVEVGK